MTPGGALRRLARWRGRYDAGSAAAKRACLAVLERRRLRTAGQVRRLHELLCFVHAYPDDAELFALAERLLAGFARRSDLRRHRAALEGSGIAGTDVVYPFFAPTARWLAERWGERLTVAWERLADEGPLAARLPLLTLWSERPVYDEAPLPARRWVERLRGRESDAVFLIRRLLAGTGDPLLAERHYDELDLPLRLAAGDGTPSRSGARWPRPAIAVQARPLARARPDPRREAARPPRAVASLGAADADAVIELARSAMVTRARDLYAFQSADPRDARRVDCGDGLELALIGIVPERRLLLEAVYGLLMLRNGVPIGYALVSALWRSAEIAFNVFESFRQAEAARVFGRVLATARSLLGAETFAVDPYQLGHGNAEGLDTGAWWFYYKLGFRPRHRPTAALARREAERLARRPGRRTPRATLEELVRAHLFLEARPRRAAALGAVDAAGIGLAASRAVAARFGADREAAEATLAEEAAARLGVAGWRRWAAGAQLAWRRWAPLVAILPGLDRWRDEERAALVAVIRAKGGRRESDFVRRFDAHPRLAAALLALAGRRRAGGG